MKKQVMFTRVLCSLLAIALLLGGVPASALVGNLYSEGLDVASAFELDGEFVSRSASTGAKAAPGDDVPKFDLDVEQTKEIIAECHCVLVFDLVTEKPIDFWSKLNMYYGTGTEHAEYEEY